MVSYVLGKLVITQRKLRGSSLPKRSGFDKCIVYIKEISCWFRLRITNLKNNQRLGGHYFLISTQIPLRIYNMASTESINGITHQFLR